MTWLKKLPMSFKILLSITAPLFLATIYQIASMFFIDPKNDDRFMELTIVYFLCGLVGFLFVLLIEVKHKLIVMTLVGVVYFPAVIFVLDFYSLFFSETFFNTALGGFLMKLAYHR